MSTYGKSSSPELADPNDANLLRPKTLLECCQCAQEFLDEYDLNDGYDNGTLYLMRVFGHRTRMLTQFQYLQAAVERNDRHCYLWTLTNMLRLVFNMANESRFGFCAVCGILLET